MKQADLNGKRVTVFGLGLNEGGVGTVEFLERAGVREIIVTDVKKRDDLLPSLKKLERYKNITYILGQHRPEDFTHTDLVVKNPAIPWTNEYVRLAESKGIPVEMDSSLFFASCRNKIYGVTGTKGKTTVASMLAHILESAGRPVARVGISQTPVLGMLEKVKPGDTVVFELSSWRLSALGRAKRSPELAVFTNLYPDHLNYYRTMAGYRKDKKYIYQFQKKTGILVANDSLDFIREEPPAGTTLYFSESGTVSGNGGFFRDDEALAVRDGVESVLFRKSELLIPGVHNQGNMLAAALAAFASGVEPAKIAASARTFKGVPHRLEFVLEKKGVSFYNDTAATIPEAVISALRSFDRPVILIAGGADKNLSFGDFAEEILARTKGAVFFSGNATEGLLREIRNRLPADDARRQFEVAPNMEKAVELAYRAAEPGDIVLLSPGAASFGMFTNEFDRGERFRTAVAALPGA